MKSFDVVVIGGGISGLSLAHYCANAGLRSCVIEQNRRAGGAIQTERFDKGFWLELGAHTCYNSYGHLLDILADCALMDELSPRQKLRWAFWAQDRAHSVASRLHWLELLRALPRMALSRREGQSVAAYYSAVVGPRNFSEVVLPLLSAVVSQDARDFPAELIFKKRPRRKDVLRSFTLAGGLGTLVEGLIAGDRFSLVAGSPVRELRYSGGAWRVGTEEGDRFQARAVALATPAGAAARLLRGAMPVLASVLARIPERAVDTVGVVTRAGAVPLARLAGLVSGNGIFHSVVSRDVVPHSEFRGFAFHCRPGIPESERLEGVARVLGVQRWQLEKVVHASHVLPSLSGGHDKLVAAIDRRIAGRKLAISGNYFGGLALQDCVARSAAEAERLLAVL